MERVLIALALLGIGLPAGFGGGQLARASTGSGNITVEVRDLDSIRDGLQKLTQANGAALKNYSEHSNKRGKGSLNASYELKKTSVNGFMDGLARLGKMTSRSYNDQNNSGYDLEARQRRLGSFRRHLQRVLAAPGADPEIVTLLVQQIQSLESQSDLVLRGGLPYGETASISVQIVERGYNAGSGFFLSPAAFVILAAVFFCGIGVALGIMLSRLSALKGMQKKPAA